MAESTVITIFAVAAGLTFLLMIFLALAQISIKLTDLIHEASEIRWAIQATQEPSPRPTADYDEALRESPRQRGVLQREVEEEELDSIYSRP